MEAKGCFGTFVVVSNGHEGRGVVRNAEANVELRALEQFKLQRFTGVREVVFKRAGGGFP